MFSSAEVKSAEIVLVVPTSLTELTIEYLEGDRVVGIFTTTVPPGSTSFVIEDPAWSDVGDLESIEVTPASATIPFGMTQDFRATGSFDDGSTQDLTTAVLWTTLDPSIATVDAAGIVSGLAAGNTTLTATLDGITGSTVLTVTAAPLVELTVSPGTISLLSSGRARTFSVSGRFSDGIVKDLTEQVEWSSSNPAVAAVSNNIGTKGQVRTTGVGTTDILATMAGVTGAIQVTVASDLLVRYPGRSVLGTAQLSGIAQGDINEDGRVDLALLGSSGPESADVQILLGQGDGTFLPVAWRDEAWGHPRAIALGDVNGDTHLDLAVATYADFLPYHNDFIVYVVIGNGDGTFQNFGAESFLLDVNVNGPSAGVGIAFGHINGDGRLDIAACNSGSNNASVFLGGGDGTFQAARNFPVGISPGSIALGDLNADGRLDLVTGNLGSDDVSVLLGNGDGSYQAARNFSVGDAPSDVTLGEVNGDGRLDLAACNGGSDNVSVLLGNGDGSFQSARNISVGDAPLDTAFGDLNGDGRLDLCTLGSNASTLLGVGDGTFRRVQSFPQGGVELALGDLNADGRLDLSTAGGFNLAGGTILLGNGDGTLQASREVRLPDNDNISALAVGDVNRDGHRDLALSRFSNSQAFLDTASILLGNGDGSFQAALNFSVGDSPSGIALGDLNGDGHIDLATCNTSSDNATVLLGNGDGSFQGIPNLPLGDGPFGVALGDVNGDGHLDLTTANVVSDDVSVLLGNGDGSFQGLRTFPVGDAPRDIAVGDINGDGIVDIVAANANSDDVSVLLGSGNANFSASRTSPAGNDPFSVVIGDLNGDGRPDLVTNSSVLLGSGDGTFQVSQSLSLLGEIAIGEVNGDGRPDLISSGGAVLLGNGDGTLQPEQDFAVPIGPFALGDLNEDGCLDLAAGGAGSVLRLLLQIPVTP